MKKLNLCGWAVIFTVTFLLAACATHTSKVADTDTMSGPDATITQPETVKQTLVRQQNELLINQAWLDERETLLDQRERELQRRENALAIDRAWLSEREMQLDRGIPDLTQEQEIMALKAAWLDEREMLVEQMEFRATGPANGWWPGRRGPGLREAVATPR